MKLLNIPKNNASDTTVTLVGILKKNGSKVSAKELICDYETSKALFEMESEYDGFIYFLYGKGEKIEVGKPVCFISDKIISIEEFEKTQKELLQHETLKNYSGKIVSRKAQLLLDANSIDVSVFSEQAISEKTVQNYLKQQKTDNDLSLRQYQFKENDLLIYGIGGHAGMCIDIVKSNSRYDMVGFIDDNKTEDVKYGLMYFGTIHQLDNLIKSGLKKLILGIGFIDNLKKRERLYFELKAKLQIPTIVHKSALIEPSASIGEGCQIMAGAIIGSNTVVKDNCIINSGAIVSHDSTINNSSHITPGAVIAGHVTIGERTTIGMCSTVYIGLEIGNDIVINNNERVIH